MKKCWLCGEDMIEKVEDIEFQKNDKTITLKNIKHNVCTNCGEKVFPREAIKKVQ